MQLSKPMTSSEPLTGGILVNSNSHSNQPLLVQEIPAQALERSPSKVQDEVIGHLDRLTSNPAVQRACISTMHHGYLLSGVKPVQRWLASLGFRSEVHPQELRFSKLDDEGVGIVVVYKLLGLTGVKDGVKLLGDQVDVATISTKFTIEAVDSIDNEQFIAKVNLVEQDVSMSIAAQAILPNQESPFAKINVNTLLDNNVWRSLNSTLNVLWKSPNSLQAKLKNKFATMQQSKIFEIDIAAISATLMRLEQKCQQYHVNKPKLLSRIISKVVVEALSSPIAKLLLDHLNKTSDWRRQQVNKFQLPSKALIWQLDRLRGHIINCLIKQNLMAAPASPLAKNTRVSPALAAANDHRTKNKLHSG